MSKTALAIGEIIGGAALLILSGPIGAAFFLSAGSLLALQTIAITTVLTGTIGLLQPTAPVQVQNGQLNISNPVAFRRINYGRSAVNAGVPTFSDYPLLGGHFQNSGYDYQWLHFVYTLTGHQITKFNAVIIDGITYTLGVDLILQGNGYYELTSAAAGSAFWDGSSGYNTGSLIAFEFDTGDPNNTSQPFPGLAAASSKWTSKCLQRGCAKVHVAFRYCADLATNPSNISPAPINPYAGSRIPKLQFDIVGKPILDTRGKSWIGNTNFNLWDRLTDFSENVEVATDGGTSGPVLPGFAVNQGGTVADGGVIWTNAGQLPSGKNWAPGVAFAFASLVIDANENVQFLNNPGGITTGSMQPTWATAVGATTTDGGVAGAWVCLGPVFATAANPSNPALVVYDYLTDTDYGMKVDPDSIDLATVNAAANICDVNVIRSWNNAGFVIEPRYSCDGMFDHSSTRGTALKSLCDSMGGFAVPPGDKWRIYAGAYTAPTLTLTDDDLRDGIKADFRISRRDTANGIKGTFFPSVLPIAATSPAAHLPPQNWQQTDFPPYQGNGLQGHPNYISEDGGEIIWKDIQLPFTTSLWAAQRLAKIQLQKLRFQVTLTLLCKMTAYPIQAGDTITFIHSRWTTLVPPAPTTYFVQQATVVVENKNGAPTIGVDLVLRQTDVTVFSFTGASSPTNQGEYSPYNTTGVY